MRKIVGLIAFTALVVIALSCASDIVLEEEFSLKGLYKGRYIWKDNETQQERVQNIEWKFTDINFKMNADPNNFLDECFCEAWGTYELTERIKLDENSPIPQPDLGCEGSCDQELGPDGLFTLEQPGDSIKLTYQSDDGDTLKQILLVRVSQ